MQQLLHLQQLQHIVIYFNGMQQCATLNILKKQNIIETNCSQRLIDSRFPPARCYRQLPKKTFNLIIYHGNDHELNFNNSGCTVYISLDGDCRLEVSPLFLTKSLIF